MKKKEMTFACYKNFKCKAEKCTHNCCLNWEIDIDKRTLKKYADYAKKKGGFSDRIRAGVDFENSRFIMRENGGESRCFFLGDDNLCEIIKNLGEKYLCQVCRDHPRFKNFIGKTVECGIGLCCEEGAHMLICGDVEMIPVKTDGESVAENITDHEKKILNFRDSILRIAAFPARLDECIKNILGFCGVDENRFYASDFKKLFSRMETLIPERKATFMKTDVVRITADKETEKRLKRLLNYFIYRHLPRAVDNIDLKSRTLFAVLSVSEIFSLYQAAKDKTVENFIEIAREYSEETEYSDDNYGIILDFLDGFSV